MLLPVLLAKAVALVGGTVHTMVPGEEPYEATVLIEEQRISVVGDLDELPPGCERIDVTGKHLVPGLIDAMVSFDRDHDALYVSAGITAVRDIGGKRIENLLERRPESRERTPGPMLYTAGAPLDGEPPATSDAAIVRNAESAEGIYSLIAQDRLDFVNVLRGIPADSWAKIVELAHKDGLTVWGPVPGAMTLHQAIEGGQDGILVIDQLLPKGVEWAIVQPPAFDQTVAKMVAAGTAVVPALHASAVRLEDQGRNERANLLLEILSPSYEQWWVAEAYERTALFNETVLRDGQRAVQKRRDLVARLVADGVPVVPGSGSPNPWLFPGQALHQELAQWVEAGLTRTQVLDLATRGAAEELGIAEHHGTIAPGRFADIVCVNSDPRDDLSILLDPELVVLRGRVLDRRDLGDLMDTVHRAQVEARRAIAQPIPVAEPPMPEGALVLAGQVESYALRQRMSAERFAVIRRPDGSIAYTSRLVYPDRTGQAQIEVTVEQVTLDGQLERFRLSAHSGDSVLTCEGIRVAQAFRIQREVDGVSIEGVQVSKEKIRVLDAGSITSMLILGQLDLADPFAVLSFREGLDYETANWMMQVTDTGDHQLRTHKGQMAFRFDETGAPVVQRVQVGQGVIQTMLVGKETFGGPGFPLPAHKKKLIEAARAAEAAATGGGEGPVPETEGGEPQGDTEGETPPPAAESPAEPETKPEKKPASAGGVR